jgi:hypothetical protein
MDEIKEKKSFSELIISNKEYIYPALFYVAGLLLGSLLLKTINNTAISKLIELVLNNSKSAFFAVFLNRFSLYISIYALCVLLGMCLIGFPIINIVMLLSGCEIALKIAYYYVNFGVKGVGFSMLMLIPEGAAIATVLIYSIKTSAELSKNIYEIAAKGTTNRIEIKQYFKKYLIYALFVALISLINALVSFLLGAIISI